MALDVQRAPKALAISGNAGERMAPVRTVKVLLKRMVRSRIVVLVSDTI
jgi:hypothetical protein